jgi:hypothetical protein
METLSGTLSHCNPVVGSAHIEWHESLMILPAYPWVILNWSVPSAARPCPLQRDWFAANGALD